MIITETQTMIQRDHWVRKLTTPPASCVVAKSNCFIVSNFEFFAQDTADTHFPKEKGEIVCKFLSSLFRGILEEKNSSLYSLSLSLQKVH